MAERWSGARGFFPCTSLVFPRSPWPPVSGCLASHCSSRVLLYNAHRQREPWAQPRAESAVSRPRHPRLYLEGDAGGPGTGTLWSDKEKKKNNTQCTRDSSTLGRPFLLRPRFILHPALIIVLILLISILIARLPLHPTSQCPSPNPIRTSCPQSKHVHSQQAGPQ